MIPPDLNHESAFQPFQMRLLSPFREGGPAFLDSSEAR